MSFFKKTSRRQKAKSAWIAFLIVAAICAISGLLAANFACFSAGGGAPQERCMNQSDFEKILGLGSLFSLVLGVYLFVPFFFLRAFYLEIRKRISKDPNAVE